MKFIFHIILIMGLGTVKAQQQVQESFYNKEIKGELYLEQKGDYVSIQGVASNLTEVSSRIRYELTVFKKDASNNNSKNSQEGRGVINAKSKAILSTTTVNTNNPSKITILLLIYDLNDKLIGKDRKVLNENTVQLEKDKITARDGVELRGIVIEKTRTKPARDFYDYFFRQYNNFKINGSLITTVEEKFGQGRNSQIEITVGREVVYKFFVTPKKKYMEQMGDNAIRQVYRRFLQLKEQETN